MSISNKLHWSQRIALIRHNLHVASRTGDFGFFKALQAQEFANGDDHVASLRSLLGDDADGVLSNLDNLNAVIAYVHEDAFRNVCDSVETGTGDQRSIFYTDMIREKQTADSSIDKMMGSAVELIQSQPVGCQEEAASVLIMGTTFIADAVEVCLRQMKHLGLSADESVRNEDAWLMVQCAVGSAVTASKGVFSLMSADVDADNGCQREKQRDVRSRSTDSFARSIMRRMSTSVASIASTPSTPSSRRSSINPAALPQRPSVSSLSSITLQSKRPLSSGLLSLMTPIPATPGTGEAECMIDPFDSSFLYDLSQQTTSPRRPSSVIAPHEDAPSLIDFNSNHPSEPTIFGSPQNYTAAESYFHGGPEAKVPSDATPRRRRSTHVQGPAPGWEGLLNRRGSQGSIKTVTLADEAQEEWNHSQAAGQWGFVRRISNAFAPSTEL